MTNLKDKILTEIEAGEIKMRPKIYFTLKMVAIVALSVVILVISIFIVGYIFFGLRESHKEALLGFGSRGFVMFLSFFPWHLLLIDLSLVVILRTLLRHFKFGYRIPALYLLAGLFLASLVLGAAVDRATPINNHIFTHHPPPRGSGICRCVVIENDGNFLVVEDSRIGTGTLRVLLPLDDRRATSSGINRGDVIFVAGPEHEGVIKAFGIHRE